MKDGKRYSPTIRKSRWTKERTAITAGGATCTNKKKCKGQRGTPSWGVKKSNSTTIDRIKVWEPQQATREGPGAE